MQVNLNEGRKISIFVDEQNNLAIFSYAKNPRYCEVTQNSVDPFERVEHPYVLTCKPIELYYPYSCAQMADAIEKGIHLWGNCEPYLAGKKSIEEYYYHISGFKNATRGKRMISLIWNEVLGKRVDILLPAKQRNTYIGIETKKLPPDASWHDFAQAVKNLIDLDLTKTKRYKTYKKDLNV